MDRHRLHVGYWLKATERGGANPFESLLLHTRKTDGRVVQPRKRRGEEGNEEVRRLTTIGADVTSTERESSRMQLFDHPG